MAVAIFEVAILRIYFLLSKIELHYTEKGNQIFFILTRIVSESVIQDVDI